MHLWPSLKLRNSFKSTNQKRFQRKNSGNSNQQKLLSGGDKDADPEISSSVFAVICKDLTMVLSCCFGCFCCIACIDEEEI